MQILSKRESCRNQTNDLNERIEREAIDYTEEDYNEEGTQSERYRRDEDQDEKRREERAEVTWGKEREIT